MKATGRQIWCKYHIKLGKKPFGQTRFKELLSVHLVAAVGNAAQMLQERAVIRAARYWEIIRKVS